MVLMQKPSMIDSPSGRSPEKAPRWDLTGTEGCGGGKEVSWLSLMFLGYKSIYRRKKYVGGAPWGPRGRGRAYPLGAPSCLVAGSQCPRLQLQVFWIAFGPRKIIAKVSFLWTPFGIPFLQNSKIGKKTEIGTGPPVNRLVPKII